MTSGSRLAHLVGVQALPLPHVDLAQPRVEAHLQTVSPAMASAVEAARRRSLETMSAGA